MEPVVLLEQRDLVAEVRLNRPEQLNALNSAVLEALDAVLARLEADTGVRVVIVRGSGEKAFVAGADIAEMATLTPAQAADLSRRGQRVLDRLAALPMPVIAMVQGFALGGGCELALACDIRIAGEKARFGQPETGLGIMPGFGGTQRLAHLVGPGRAKILIFGGGTLDAATALDWGLADQVVPQEALERTVEELATAIAAKPPYAVRQVKRAINLGARFEAGLACEAEAFGLCFAQPERQALMRAFLDKKKTS